jgi:hypothetical protein
MFEQLMPKLKVCLHCGEEKTDDEFHKRRNRDGTMGRRAVCRICWHKSRGNPGKRVRNS